MTDYSRTLHEASMDATKVKLPVGYSKNMKFTAKGLGISTGIESRWSCVGLLLLVKIFGADVRSMVALFGGLNSAHPIVRIPLFACILA